MRDEYDDDFTSRTFGPGKVVVTMDYGEAGNDGGEAEAGIAGQRGDRDPLLAQLRELAARAPKPAPVSAAPAGQHVKVKKAKRREKPKRLKLKPKGKH
jgi:hypothetical protein